MFPGGYPGTPPGRPAPVVERGGSWGSLQAALVQDLAPVLDDHCCPNDGTPLRTGPDGGLFCPFDGWRSRGGAS